MTETEIRRAKVSFNIELLKLASGGHGADIPDDPNCEVCFNEYVSLLEGAHSKPEMTDHPDNVCPALTSYSISLNDRWPDADRQKLKRFALDVIGTRGGPDLEARRRQFLLEATIKQVYVPYLRELPGGRFAAAADRLEQLPLGDHAALLKIRFEYLNETMRVRMPKLLRAAKEPRPDLAEKCEALAPVTDDATAAEARYVARRIRDAFGWWGWSSWRAWLKAKLEVKFGSIAASTAIAASDASAACAASDAIAAIAASTAITAIAASDASAACAAIAACAASDAIAAIAAIAAITAIAASATSAVELRAQFESLRERSVERTLVVFKAAIELR